MTIIGSLSSTVTFTQSLTGALYNSLTSVLSFAQNLCVLGIRSPVLSTALAFVQSFTFTANGDTDPRNNPPAVPIQIIVSFTGPTYSYIFQRLQFSSVFIGVGGSVFDCGRLVSNEDVIWSDLDDWSTMTDDEWLTLGG